MVEVSGHWTETQVETFLEESTIPIRIGTHRQGGTIWIVAMWYAFSDGVFECATNANAKIINFLQNDPKVAFDVSTNSPPYRGVRGTGNASITADSGKNTLETLIDRYLDDSNPTLSAWLLGDARKELRIQIVPEELYSWDFSDRMDKVDNNVEVK